jgi:hypothetical protein
MSPEPRVVSPEIGVLAVFLLVAQDSQLAI